MVYSWPAPHIGKNAGSKMVCHSDGLFHNVFLMPANIVCQRLKNGPRFISEEAVPGDERPKAAESRNANFVDKVVFRSDYINLTLFLCEMKAT